MPRLSTALLTTALLATTCTLAAAQCPPRWITTAPVFNGDVRAFTQWNGGLVAVGSFTQVAGAPAGGVAFWDGETWTPIGPAAPAGNRRAVVDFNGTLVVQGQVLTNNQWQPIGPGLTGTVRAHAVYNGELYAGGTFTSPASAVARFNGTSWVSAGPALSGTVNDLVVYNGTLVACGTFPSPTPGHTNNIARWNGTAWSGMGAALVPTTPLRMGVAEGDLFVSGYSSLQGWVTVFDGSAWSPGFETVNIEPAGFAEYDGAVYVGGGTTLITRRQGVWTQSPQYLAAPGLPTSYALGVHDGALFVGGYFTSVQGQPATNIARYYVPSADFNADSDFGTDQDIEAFFRCLAGNCCAACGSADFDGDGSVGTDADIEAFFRVLSGACA